MKRFSFLGFVAFVLGLPRCVCGQRVELAGVCPPATLSAAILLGGSLGLQSGDSVLLAQAHHRPAAGDLKIFAARSWTAPDRFTRFFAVDAAGHAYRVAGFDTVDAEAFVCHLRAKHVTSVEQAWLATYDLARTLDPLGGDTYLVGVLTAGVPEVPRGEALTDSAGFHGPELRQQASGTYDGIVTVLWRKGERTHVVEWRFALQPDGRIRCLNERVVAGQQHLRRIEFRRQSSKCS